MLSLGLGIAIAAAVTVCIGFLIALVLFGIRRYLSSAGTQQKENQHTAETGTTNVDEKQEMEWDNSALNITVNPLDNLGDDALQLAVRDADEESDDCSACDSSDEEREMPRCKELEWDDSTLTF